MKHGLSIASASFCGVLVLGAGFAQAQPKPAALSCSTATLFAGNPLYDGQPNDRANPGTGIKADPPFHWQNLVFVGNLLYSRDAGELWAVDTSAANPVVERIAGKNPSGSNYAFAAGPCANARFGWIKGIAPVADGGLLVVDGLANAVLKVKDPTGASCTVEYWAGTMTPKPELNPSFPPNVGDQDGPGAKAKFSNPGPIVTDDADNAYVYDSDSRKIKKIANDAEHTISTLGGKKIDAPYTIRNMTRIGSKLYGIGDDSTKATVVEVDTATGATRTVIEGRTDAFPPLAPGRSATLHGITTDGTGLIISGLGYVWYLTTAGKLTHIAGDGVSYIDFPKSGYDPKASQPALKVQLPGARAAASPEQEVGSFEFITYHKGAIYTRGARGTGYFVEKISCP
jgi:hypothetical protein